MQENEEKKPEELKENIPMVDAPLVDASPQLQSLADEMPTVVPDAVNSAKEKEQTQVQENKKYVDNKGRAFDPNVHAVDQNGAPIMTPTGRFKHKPITAGVLNLPPQEQKPDMSYRAVAQTAVSLFIQVGYGFVGDEWLPEKTKDMDEEGNLVQVTEDYCRSIGLKDLPPGIVCATAFIAYGLRRFNKPKVKSLREKIGTWLKLRYASVWLWFQKKSEKREQK